MREKEARETIKKYKNLARDDNEVLYCRGYLEAIEKAKGLVEALSDIDNFHDKTPVEYDKKYGFTGWTCCGQKESIAKEALAQWEKEK